MGHDDTNEPSPLGWVQKSAICLMIYIMIIGQLVVHFNNTYVAAQLNQLQFIYKYYWILYFLTCDTAYLLWYWFYYEWWDGIVNMRHSKHSKWDVAMLLFKTLAFSRAGLTQKNHCA